MTDFLNIKVGGIYHTIRYEEIRIDKKDVENETFECELKLITEGTCSPWIYDLKNVDETDYTTFELN